MSTLFGRAKYYLAVLIWSKSKVQILTFSVKVQLAKKLSIKSQHPSFEQKLTSRFGQKHVSHKAYWSCMANALRALKRFSNCSLPVNHNTWIFSVINNSYLKNCVLSICIDYLAILVFRNWNLVHYHRIWN